jgi:hypothetical protein
MRNEAAGLLGAIQFGLRVLGSPAIAHFPINDAVIDNAPRNVDAVDGLVIYAYNVEFDKVAAQNGERNTHKGAERNAALVYDAIVNVPEIVVIRDIADVFLSEFQTAHLETGPDRKPVKGLFVRKPQGHSVKLVLSAVNGFI